MSDFMTAFLEPQVLVAFVTFVIAPIVSVLVALRKPGTSPAVKTAAVAATAKVRASESVLMEAFAQWSDTQGKEVIRLQDEVKRLMIEITNVKRLNLFLRQHNAVLIQQLVRLGEVPYPSAEPDEGEGSAA